MKEPSVDLRASEATCGGECHYGAEKPAGGDSVAPGGMKKAPAE